MFLIPKTCTCMYNEKFVHNKKIKRAYAYSRSKLNFLCAVFGGAKGNIYTCVKSITSPRTRYNANCGQIK